LDLSTIFLLIVMVFLGFLLRRQSKRVLSLRYELANRIREKSAVFDFLNRLGELVTTRLDQQGTLQLVVQFLQDATKADAAAIFLRQPDEPDVLRAAVVQGLFPPLHKTTTDRLLAKRKFVAEKVRKDSIRVGEGIVGRVADTGKGMLITDAARDERVPREASEVIPIRDLLLAPILVRDEVLGVIALVNKREDGPFGDNDMSLVTAIADQAAVTIDLVRLYAELSQKQRMEQELRVAKEFQEMLLPRKQPKLDSVDIAGFNRPALEVGGDYFDYIDVDEDHVGIAIADVSGKGTPGAMVMASVRATLRAEARGELSPKQVLTRVNAQAVRDTKTGVFITMTYGVLNIRTGAFRFARAGHDPLICCRGENEPLSLHEPNGIALGLVEGDIFGIIEEEEISLRTEKTIILYTDGVVEAMDEQKKEYGQPRLHEVVKTFASEPPPRIVEEIVRDIESFTEGRDQHDDITIVVLQWKNQSEQTTDGLDRRVATTA
jgi:sigma-B regulation protein RsbU (phosphoserine phosphatase)